MEGIKPAVESEESLEGWHSLKEQAPDIVEETLNERFPNFESLEVNSRILFLEQLISEYDAPENFNNDNRFLVEEIAQRLTLEKARWEMEKIIQKHPELA